MAEKRDYYEVLGVSKSATQDEIKKAYRKIAKENHPDQHPGDKACEERFKEANEAYEVQIRVVGLGDLAVCLFDFLGRGVLCNAQNLIIITFLCHVVSPIVLEYAPLS